MLSSNRFKYRAEILCEFLDQNPKSEGFKVIADAFAREMECAFLALASETADSYQISEKSLTGLQSLQPDMIEVRLLQRLDQDPTSWLNQLRLMSSTSYGPPVSDRPEGLISSDRGNMISTPVNLDKDKGWFIAVLQQWNELVVLIRQSSINE